MDILIIALAVVFVVSGLSKASGNAKGLSGTRDVNVPDWLARLTVNQVPYGRVGSSPTCGAIRKRTQVG